MRVAFYQASGSRCSNTNDLMRGFQELGVTVYSNVISHDFVLSTNGTTPDWFDAVFVSTTGNENNDFDPGVPYVFVDGRDTEQINKPQLSRASYYFKTNARHADTLLLPSCVDPAHLRPPDKQREVPISFFVAHERNGRAALISWLDEIKALVLKAPVINYWEWLADSFISVNAPGGGVNTTLFFDIIGSGCVCFNYVPLQYHQEINNILDIIPDDFMFPKHAVVNFSTEEELWAALESTPLSHAAETYEWARSWGFKEKAAYVLKTVL